MENRYKLGDLEVSNIYKDGSFIRGYSFNLVINKAIYEASIFKYPNGWFILNDSFKKIGGINYSSFKDEKTTAIREHIKNILKLD